MLNIFHRKPVKAAEKADLPDLLKRANETGILSVSAHGGITEHTLKDAVETSEYLDKYFAGVALDTRVLATELMKKHGPSLYKELEERRALQK